MKMVKKHWPFLIALFIFIALLLRDPFSMRTLIPNLEPYPDTIHYLNSARSFIEGKGLQITREGRSLKMGVPPLYSLSLIPIFILNKDVRMFYFTNVILALVSFLFFYKILRKVIGASDQRLSTNNLILFFSLFLYVTNYFFYWYPSLAMAENLTLFLFMANLSLMITPINRVTLVLGAIVPFCFFLTKYANIPLTGSFLLLYFIKIFIESRRGKRLDVYNLLYFGGGVGSMLIIIALSGSFPGASSLLALFGTFLPITKSAVPTPTTGGWFGIEYMSRYLPDYIRSLFGGYQLRFLWDTTPIVPFFAGTLGMIGLILGLINSKTRLLVASLWTALISSILFMSTFYSFDMRYVFHAIPTLLIGLALFWNFVFQIKFPKFKYLHVLFVSLIVCLFAFYFLSSAIRIKKQIMLNIKYAETPWYYISVLTLNNYFKSYPVDKKEPVVISAMMPYYIDFFSNNSYALLPLSLSQEFRSQRDAAWGKFDYSDLIMLYSKVLYSGHEVFVHNYGIGNEKPLQEDFKKIQDNFILEKVASGCFDACNIWRLKAKYPLLKKIEFE